MEKACFLLPPKTRLDVFLTTFLSQAKPTRAFSRSMIQSWIQEGRVQIQKQIITKPAFKAKTTLRGEIQIPPPKTFALKPSQNRVPIIFENEHFAVVHKPAPMTVHPGAGTQDDTLVHALLGQIHPLSKGSDQNRPGIVHRLDRETEGLLLVAKHNEAHFQLAQLFAQRKVKKIYHAWLFGKLPQKTASLHGIIQRHPRERKKMQFVPQENITSLDEKDKDEQNKKWAELSYEKKLFKEKNHLCFSLARIFLHTGRTHQIRASFLHLQAPVVGDTLYTLKKNKHTNTQPFPKAKLNHGLLLAATWLSFPDPFSGQIREFELPLPERFKSFEKFLG